MTTDARTLATILDADKAQAEAAASAAVIAESLELAPLSYATLRELRGTPALGEALAALPDELVRAQAVRFLVERRAATGALWGWGDVDDVEARFRRVIAQTRADALARRIGRAQAQKIAEMIREETRMEPETNALGEPMPPTAGEALARQLVAELNEMEALGQVGQFPTRYDAKSAQVRALGYEIGPDADGRLCLWRADNTGPLDAAPAPVAYTLPAPALVRDSLARLAATAQAAGDAANANAFNRADYQISRGIYPAVAVSADGSLLVPSKESAGTVYRVSETGCSCTAGINGRPCWHAALAEALATARDEAAALLDDDALPFDPADDAAYLDSLMELDPARFAA